jgi:beta-lactamase superfamily II metal-dependent hydrolase
MPGLHDYYETVLGLDLAEISYIDADLVFARLEGSGEIYELAFGDAVNDVRDEAEETQSFAIVGGRFHGQRARVKGALKTRKKPILRLSMIDVQQGDGLILDTPAGKLITIDGGDNQLFARHLAARFSGSTAENPLQIDAMIVTHGDADHFAGLVEIAESETLKKTPAEPDREKKRVFISPASIFHNGLVKRPSALPEKDSLGATAEKNGALFAVDLVESPLDVPRDAMNKPFREWAQAIDHWNARRAARGQPPIVFRRVDHKAKAVLADHLKEKGLKLEVLGPVTEKVGGRAALPFFRAPEKDAELHLQGQVAARGAISASHTINGHSISFRLVYKNVRFMFTGDLNQESMARLAAALPDAEFQSEILKAPHHGSADFDFGFVKKVSPVVSMISSGDESSAKEYIHPRATFVSAMGRASRGDTGIVFMTELAAFFAVRGYSVETKPAGEKDKAPFFAFERKNFGIIHIRTDGERVLAFTHSGKRGMNEAYGFSVDDKGKVKITKKLVSQRG